MSAYTTSADNLNYQFTGQEYDQETGLYNFHARMYDEAAGRFYAVDPAGQFDSPYTGMGNNPVMYVDPDGEWAIIDDVIAGWLLRF